MGWLMDLMEDMDPPVRSYAALARRVLASPRLRSTSTLKHGSLATYLGKLDTEKDLTVLDEYLDERRVLADALGLSLEDFDAQLQERKAPRAQRKDFRVELSDIEVSPIDLRSDDLPPGIPEEVLLTPRWPLWWNAPSGSGRTLVGRWLEARKLATFIQADTWENAERDLTPGFPNFVELSSATGIPRPEEVEGLRFCVAVHGQPVTMVQDFLEPRQVVDPDWKGRIVSSPPVSSWLEELLQYLETRRPSDSGFTARQCLAWMRKELLPDRLIDGLGAALGFAGLFATYHHRLKGDTGHVQLVRLAENFLRKRKEHAPAVQESAPRLWDALRHMGRGLLTQNELPWNEARPLSSWYELARAGPSPLTRKWLQEPQVRQALQVEERKLKKALEALPLDEYVIVQSLRELGVLREQQRGVFALRPPWLLHVMTEEAAALLIMGAPEEWGAALFHAHCAPRIIRRLSKHCDQRDFEPFRKLLRSPEPASAAWVAALEGSVRVLGLATLMGKGVPEDILEPVYDWQQRLAIARHGDHPFPRLTFDGSRDELFLSRGFWLAACFALSEKLERRQDWSQPVLFPWKGEPPAESLQAALNELWDVVGHKQARESLRLALLSLAARLLDTLGPRPSHFGPVHPVLAPEFLLRHFREGALRWDMLGQHSSWYEILPVMPAYLSSRRVPWVQFARATWEAWLASGQDSNSLFLGHELNPLLWQHLPPAVLLDARFKRVLFHELVPYDVFQAEHWDAFLVVLRQGHDRTLLARDQARPWQFMPEPHVRRAISEGLLDPYVHEIYRTVWERMPEAVLEELRRLVHRKRWEDALQLAWNAPPQLMRDVLPILEEARALPLEMPHERVTHWLHAFIGQRAPGWEAAWTVLGRLAKVTERA